MSRLDEIRARASAATKGPWTENRYYQCVQTGSGDLKAVCRFGNVGARVPADDYFGNSATYEALSKHPEVLNAEFIAHAREDVPYLLEQLGRCRPMLFEALRWPQSCPAECEATVCTNCSSGSGDDDPAMCDHCDGCGANHAVGCEAVALWSELR